MKIIDYSKRIATSNEFRVVCSRCKIEIPKGGEYQRVHFERGHSESMHTECLYLLENIHNVNYGFWHNEQRSDGKIY